MSFTYPWLLLLLILPVLLLAGVWVRKERRLVLPFDHGRGKRGLHWFFLMGLAESLPALIVALVAILLAGPTRLAEPKTKRQMTNIELCVDISGSMTARFGDGTRYDAAMQAIGEFLDFRKGDAFGLTFFGNNYLHWVPLTSDVSAVRCAPPFMRPEVAPYWFRGTEIGKALLACKKVLIERQEGDRMILLVSDGHSSDLSNGNDQAVAKDLKANNIVVYSVHIAEGPVPDQIVNLTQLTGGQAFAPHDPEALAGVFRRIDQMQQAKLEKTLPESMDFFEPFVLAALTLLGMSTFALFGWRYTPW